MTTQQDYVRLGQDNPHVRAYHEYLHMVAAFLKARRGRGSRLARHLHVPRQSVSRWFVRPARQQPAWAALAANVWMHRQLTPEARRTLSATSCPPGGRQSTPLAKHSQLQTALPL